MWSVDVGLFVSNLRQETKRNETAKRMNERNDVSKYQPITVNPPTIGKIENKQVEIRNTFYIAFCASPSPHKNQR
jgi:hypothetical protein